MYARICGDGCRTYHSVLWKAHQSHVTVFSDKKQHQHNLSYSRFSTSTILRAARTMQWVDFSKTSLLVSLASITFNPLAWNIVARNGTSTHTSKKRVPVPMQAHRWFYILVRISQQIAHASFRRQRKDGVLFFGVDDLFIWYPS